MKPSNSETTTPQKEPCFPIGQQAGGHGRAMQQSGSQSAAVFSQPAIEAALQDLQHLLTSWRALDAGQSLAAAMTPTQIKASSLTLNRLSQPGRAADVARIIDRLMALYPSRGEAPESVVQDWVRVLRDEPIASIWATYERFIRKPGQWAPSLGDFLQAVQLHAATVNRVKISLQP